jgi:hypothetical protein
VTRSPPLPPPLPWPPGVLSQPCLAILYPSPPNPRPPPPTYTTTHTLLLNPLSQSPPASADPDLTTLALGTDLTTLGLNLNSPEALWKTFSSPWADGPGKPEPDFRVGVQREYVCWVQRVCVCWVQQECVWVQQECVCFVCVRVCGRGGEFEGRGLEGCG